MVATRLRFVFADHGGMLEVAQVWVCWCETAKNGTKWKMSQLEMVWNRKRQQNILHICLHYGHFHAFGACKQACVQAGGWVRDKEHKQRRELSWSWLDWEKQTQSSLLGESGLGCTLEAVWNIWESDVCLLARIQLCQSEASISPYHATTSGGAHGWPSPMKSRRDLHI